MLYSTFTQSNNKFHVILSGCDDKILTHNEGGTPVIAARNNKGI